MDILKVINIRNKFELHQEVKKAIPQAVEQFKSEYKINDHLTLDKILEQLKYANWSAGKSIEEYCESMKDNWSPHPKVYQWGLNLNFPEWGIIDLQEYQTVDPLYFGFDQNKTKRPTKIRDWFNNKEYKTFNYPVAKKLRNINKKLEAWSGRFLFLIHPDHFDTEDHSKKVLAEVTKNVEKILQKNIRPILDGYYGNKEYQKYLENKEKCMHTK